MKTCLQCGGWLNPRRERQDRVKFCSSSCCNKFNKVRRKQLPKQLPSDQPKRAYTRAVRA